MAIVSLRDVQVSRVFYEGRGAEVIERYKTQAGNGEKRYTVWFDEAHGLAEGSVITVDGLLGVKLEEYTNDQGEPKQKVSIFLNKPQVKKVDSPVPVEKVGHAAVHDVWPTATLVQDDNAPF
jgi:hypothetical protein